MEVEKAFMKQGDLAVRVLRYSFPTSKENNEQHNVDFTKSNSKLSLTSNQRPYVDLIFRQECLDTERFFGRNYNF